MNTNSSNDDQNVPSPAEPTPSTPSHTDSHTESHTDDAARSTPDAVSGTPEAHDTPHSAAASVPAETLADTAAGTEKRTGTKRALLIGGGVLAAAVLLGGGVAMGAAIADDSGDDRPSASDEHRDDIRADPTATRPRAHHSATSMSMTRPSRGGRQSARRSVRRRRMTSWRSRPRRAPWLTATSRPSTPGATDRGR